MKKMRAETSATLRRLGDERGQVVEAMLQLDAREAAASDREAMAEEELKKAREMSDQAKTAARRAREEAIASLCFTCCSRRSNRSER